MSKWRDMFPEGRLIFYEGERPDDWAKHVLKTYGFDPSKDNPDWNELSGYCFLCPPEHLDAIYTTYVCGS